MSAIDQLFERLRADNQKAFMPFLTAGDPDLDLTMELVSRLEGAGCHLVELGFPYSDPIADGPVIQASYTRALNAGIHVEQIFERVQQQSSVRSMPVVAMVSYAIIFRLGPASFLDRAIAAGISGAIVPDLPVDESAEFAELCRQRDFSLIQLITPTTPKSRAIEIAGQTTGFIYYVSIAGITGERQALPAELIDNLDWLRQQTKLPICVGFGISSPEHLQALKPHCDGMIVGSAIVRRLAAAIDRENRTAVVDGIEQYVGQMLAALQE